MTAYKPFLVIGCTFLAWFTSTNITIPTYTNPRDASGQCDGIVDETTAMISMLKLVKQLVELFIPQKSETLWGAFWVFSIITWNQYVQYLSATFLWVDMTVVVTATTITKMLPFTTIAYCGEGQMIVAFYITLFTHAILCGFFPPPFFATILCLAGMLVSLSSLVFDNHCSIQGLVVASVIGTVLSIIRVVFYYDAIMPTHTPQLVPNTLSKIVVVDGHHE